MCINDFDTGVTRALQHGKTIVQPNVECEITSRHALCSLVDSRLEDQVATIR